MLLWIKGTMSPDEIRRRVTQPDLEFCQSLVAYLGSAHSGDFLDSSRAEVEANVQKGSKNETYQDPTETMAGPPPLLGCKNECKKCEQCVQLNSWWSTFKDTVNDLLLRSNTHTCTTNENKDGTRNQTQTFKGCLDNIWRRCKAHFPRPLYEKTQIDEEDGHINMIKQDSWLNTFTHVVTYLFRCNTDVTSLHSGTAIKGVLLYITNYVTKSSLKTHVIFDTIRAMFQKNPDI
ncbi:hypothetical protein L208DRAFT_1213348, partial [Tricholoma matsutake]